MFQEESAAKVAVEFKINPKHTGSLKGSLNVNWDNITPVSIAFHIPKRMPNIKPKLLDFYSLSQEKQKNILGKALFPVVKGMAGENLAPKITRMLIDSSVLEVSEILELLEDSNLLKERVQEAIELIESEGI